MCEKYIYKTCEKPLTFVIRKTLKQKYLYFGTYHSLELAIIVRDLLIQDNWDTGDNDLYYYKLKGRKILLNRERCLNGLH